MVVRCSGVVTKPFKASMASIQSIAQARSPRVSRNCSGAKFNWLSSAPTLKCKPLRPLVLARTAAASGYMDCPLSKA